ncbi:MAG: IS66 family insertion sequence element accessory protein TnpB [Gammaproteobacteria bacterium]|nr:IS66 family insertion sequence element accessory protein TnpB [Gammaproteobacteria bacterium]MDH5730280.1 IS66 family insertion sequence element accessory protein TnpB [Gammaproteobacteria bacterium]
MLKLDREIQIYFAINPINMLKSFDGLSALVVDVIEQNPLSGHLFVFRNRATDKIKLLIWDRNGFTIYYKRLERGRFKFPELDDCTHLSITRQELDLLFDGIDFTKLKRLPALHYTSVT